MRCIPDRGTLMAGLSKPTMLVVMGLLSIETLHFLQSHGAHIEVDAASIQIEVLELPTTCFAEDECALVMSDRWLQWHWAGATPPRQAKHGNWIMPQI